MNQTIPSVKNPITSKTISEQVYDKIKFQIISGQLAPGERIVQENLTEQFSVSRTPVREALQRLCSEGLVTIRPFYGAMVFDLSLESLQEVYDIRIMIETYAVRKACALMETEDVDRLADMNDNARKHQNDITECMAYDRAFHRAICCGAVSDYIIQILEGLWDKCDPYKSLYFSNPENISHMISEHDEVVDSFRRRDKDALANVISRHLEDVVEKISQTKQSD